MTGHAEISNPERRFLAFVQKWYQENLRLEIGKEPYTVVCNDVRNGGEVFSARILGVENGTLKLSAPWKNVESFETIEVSLHCENDEAMGGPHIIDLTKDENAVEPVRR